MAYIRKFRDKWRAEVQRHGHRATHVADTKREAQAWAIRKEAELDALKGSRGQTLRAAFDHYVKTVTSDKEGARAAQWEPAKFAAMLEFFGEDARIADIDSNRIGQWRDWRLAGDATHKPVSGSTVNREANLLRHVFTLAADEWRWIDRSPFKGVRMPKENPARSSTWPWQMIRRVLRAERTGKTRQMIGAFHIALHTGMRLSEILEAKVDGKVAILPKDKTTAGPVRVPLARKGAALLARYGPFTVGPNEGSTLFSKMCTELLIEGLTFHDTRASALTWLSRRVDVLTLARISRHKDLKILMASYYRESAESIAARI